MFSEYLCNTFLQGIGMEKIEFLMVQALENL